MPIHHVGSHLKGVYRLAQIGHHWDMTPHDAQPRLNILQFLARHGLAATLRDHSFFTNNPSAKGGGPYTTFTK